MPSAPRRPAAPLQAQDKLTFLLSLVPYLAERDRVSVTEAAEHFGVKPEQIRDAVRLIAVSGVPGETSTYQYEDLFDIAWDDFEENDQIVVTNFVAIDDSPRFSAREAAALMAGLQYLSSLPESADRGAVESLMAKLARGASADPSQLAVEAGETDATLALVRQAVASGVQLEFDYHSSTGEAEHRSVDPLLVESVDADWYLRAWCHLRGAIRTFRLDRIANAAVTTRPVDHLAGDVPLPERLFEGASDDVEVVIDVAAAIEPLLADYIPEGAPRSADGATVRTTLRASHFHGLKRLVAGKPGMITVVEPADARVVVAEWASAAASRYADPR